MSELARAIIDLLTRTEKRGDFFITVFPLTFGRGRLCLAPMRTASQSFGDLKLLRRRSSPLESTNRALSPPSGFGTTPADGVGLAQILEKSIWTIHE